MDILTHIASGAAVSSVIAALSMKKTFPVPRIIAAGALGGAFPDIDAVSLWSKFDVTFGKLFGLTHAGKEIYFGKYWYSHHGFFHSAAAAVIAGFLIGCLVYLYCRIRREKEPSFGTFFKINLPVYLAFMSGCLAHIAGDLPTPASVWGGMRLFWPLTDYTGGWGKIWWWNNYDIFIIIVTCLLLNIGLILSAGFIRIRVGMVTLFIALSAFLAVCYQINTRQNDYAYVKHAVRFDKSEQKSKEEQQRILGKKVFRAMNRFDDWLPINF